MLQDDLANMMSCSCSVVLQDDLADMMSFSCNVVLQDDLAKYDELQL